MSITRVAGLTLAAGENNGKALVIDELAGFLYVGTHSAPPFVVKVRCSDLIRIGAVNVDGVNSNIRDGSKDIASGKLYFVSYYLPSKVSKVDIPSFSFVSNLSLPLTYARGVSCAIDTANGFLYVGGEVNPAIITKVILSTFTESTRLTLSAGEYNPYAMAVDPINGFLYVVCQLNPSLIVKIRLSDFTRVGVLALPAGDASIESLCIDPVAGFLYAGDWSVPPQVIKIDLSTFTRAGDVTLTGLAGVRSCDISVAAGFAYFGDNGVPFKVGKVRLSDFSFVESGVAASGENVCPSLVVDSLTGNIYGATETSPCKIVKFYDAGLAATYGQHLPLMRVG